MSAFRSISFLSCATIGQAVQADPVAMLSLGKALPILKNLLGSQTKQSSKYLFDSFLAEQPRLRGKISESTELKSGDAGSERHPGWCPWLQQAEGMAAKSSGVDVFNVALKVDLFNLPSWWSKDKAEEIKQEAKHMCTDSIRVWNEYVASAEKKPTEYPNAANAARIDDNETKLLCGAFDLRQSLKFCSSKGPGLVVRVVGFDKGDSNMGKTELEFADISDNKYPIFLSASVINQKHPVIAKGRGAGIMFEKETEPGKDREIVVMAAGRDLWLPTHFFLRKEAELDNESMKSLINGKKVPKTVFDQRRQRQLQEGHAPWPNNRICVNKSWLEQQGWTKSETQPEATPGTYLRFLTGDSDPSQRQDCKSESFASVQGVDSRRAFSDSESEALEFALSDAIRLNKEKGTKEKGYQKSKHNEVMVDITAQNVNAIWMMASQADETAVRKAESLQAAEETAVQLFRDYPSSQADETAVRKAESLQAAEETAVQLFRDYVKKFNKRPLLVRIFAQAGAVFQLPPPSAEPPKEHKAQSGFLRRINEETN